MLCYKGLTFCSFYESCVVGKRCERALTQDIIDRSKINALPISQFVVRPECHEACKR